MSDVVEIISNGNTESFRIGPVIGKGGFASVYQGSRISDGLPVAIKIRKGTRTSPKMNVSHDAFDWEASAYSEFATQTSYYLRCLSRQDREAWESVRDLNRKKRVCHLDAMPRYIIHGVTTFEGRPCMAIVLTLCRANPFAWGSGMRFKHPNRWFGILCVLAHQLVSRFEALHHSGFIHRDFKPPNMCFGMSPADKYSVLLIDLGAATRWLTKDGKHIPISTRPVVDHNFDTSPVHRHDKIEYTRRSDIEMMGYMMLKIGTGLTFPWAFGNLHYKAYACKDPAEKMRMSKQIQAMKADRDSYCKDHNPVYREHLRECDKLGFYDRPNYAKLREIWKNAYAGAGFDPNAVPRNFFSHAEAMAIEKAYQRSKRKSVKEP